MRDCAPAISPPSCRWLRRHSIIPAVVFYNKLNADSEHILGGYESFADEFSTILSRQLDA